MWGPGTEAPDSMVRWRFGKVRALDGQTRFLLADPVRLIRTQPRAIGLFSNGLGVSRHVNNRLVATWEHHNHGSTHF